MAGFHTVFPKKIYVRYLFFILQYVYSSYAQQAVGLSNGIHELVVREWLREHHVGAVVSEGVQVFG